MSDLFSAPPPRLPSVNIPSKKSLEYRKRLREIRQPYAKEFERYSKLIELDEEFGCWIYKQSIGDPYTQRALTSLAYPCDRNPDYDGNSRSVPVTTWFWSAFNGPIIPAQGRLVCVCPKPHRRTTQYHERGYTCVNPDHYRQALSERRPWEKKKRSDTQRNKGGLATELRNINRGLLDALEQSRARRTGKD